MHSTYLGAALGALAGLATANELAVRGGGLPCSFDVGKSWDDAVLFKGLGSVSAEAGAAVALDVHLSTASISGSIDISVADEFLVAPTVKVDLGGLKAYFEIDLVASASVYESIELVASEKLKIAVPGLAEIDIGAALALDLVLAISAAVDVSAGFYVDFPAGSFVEISAITLEVVDKCLDNLGISSVPVAVGASIDLAAEVSINVGLRLRAELGLSAELDILGLDIGAGADLAVWINLCDVTTVVVETSSCPVSISESFALTLGVAIDLDVSVDKCFDLSLAPTITVTLATHEEVVLCLPGKTKGSGSSGSGAGKGDHGGHKGEGVTSTITSTNTYTITSCYASVTNCPASHTQKVITSTVDVYTTVCPATMTSAAAATSSSPCPTPTSTSTMSPCPTPSTSTWTSSESCVTPAPTVTVTETYSTTECPETASATATASASASASASVTASSTPCPSSTSGSSPASVQPGGPISSSLVTVTTTCTTLAGPSGTAPGSVAYHPTTAKVCETCVGSSPTTLPVTAGAAGFRAGAAAAVAVPMLVAALL